jgi:hypothetical protein
LIQCPSYYGNGESFVFTFDEDGPKKYAWSGENEFWLYSNNCLAFGGGG